MTTLSGKGYASKSFSASEIPPRKKLSLSASPGKTGSDDVESDFQVPVAQIAGTCNYVAEIRTITDLHSNPYCYIVTSILRKDAGNYHERNSQNL